MEQMNVRGRNAVQWNVLHRKPHCGNWIFCFLIYCRPTKPKLLWYFRCLIFCSLALNELIQKVNACFTSHMCPSPPKSPLSTLGTIRGTSAGPEDFAPGWGQDFPLSLTGSWRSPGSVRRQYTLRMSSSLLEQHKERGWEPNQLLGNFACGTPLLIPCAAKLTENIDFPSLVTELEW